MYDPNRYSRAFARDMALLESLKGDDRFPKFKAQVRLNCLTWANMLIWQGHHTLF